MKSKFLLLLLLLYACTISAQLVITSGAQFSVAGNMSLILQNTDLVNNGSFAAGNGVTAFTGNTASFIAGSQPVQFYELEINKTNTSPVTLQRAIGVTQRILFTSGFLDLNNFNADLGTTAHLDGEKENSRITGTNGGEVLFSTSLNAPTGSNPANLGVIITSGENLGQVTIKRGHRSQANSSGTGTTILRYYDIIPANNADLNATLRVNYHDAELNGLNENSLELYESPNATNWTSLGFTSKDAAINFVEKTGIGSFGRFTLSGAGNVLPVHFTLFNVKCEGSKVLVTWKTAQEQNSSHFDIEKSTDGTHWTVIGNLRAAGNSNTERSYFITDPNPAQNGYYRIAAYGVDGKVQYSLANRSSCTVTGIFNLWPNPVHDMVFINVVTGNESQAMIKVFDSKGALVKAQRATVVQGNNQLKVDIRSLANGTYSFYIDWNNGQMKKGVQVIKE